LHFTQLIDQIFYLLDIDIDRLPIRERKSFDKSKRLTFVEVLIAVIHLGPHFENDEHPRVDRVKLKPGWLVGLAIVFDEVINNLLGEPALLPNDDLIEPLGVDFLLIDEVFVMPKR
jgi:hypothetical protein